jgi:STIMATE family
MKIAVLVLIHMLPVIVQVGDWALRWTEGNPALQITFVMLLFPLIMNAVQYYIIDNFIKHPVAATSHPSDADDGFDASLVGDDRHRHSAMLAALSDDEGDGDDSLWSEEPSGKPVDSPPSASPLHEPGTNGKEGTSQTSSSRERLDRREPV